MAERLLRTASTTLARARESRESSFDTDDASEVAMNDWSAVNSDDTEIMVAAHPRVRRPSIATPEVPSAVRFLRRPQTIDDKDFWYMSTHNWNDLIEKSKDATTKKNSLNTLRKFDAAGRMMETDQGEPASVPCSWCTRPGLVVPCRVYKGNKEKACAYCRRHAKAGCAAGDLSRAPPPSHEDRVASVETAIDAVRETVARLEQTVARLEPSVDMLTQRLDALETWQTDARGSIAMLEHHDYKRIKANWLSKQIPD